MTTETKPRNTDVADALDRAADHIERYGWAQGALYDGRQAEGAPTSECRVCAIGAINTAVYGSPSYPAYDSPHHDLALLAERWLRVYLQLDTVTLPEWNDALGRTQEQVVQAMRDTAKRLREETP
ncbi:hypothetical protein C9F11_37930 [Streptomyces sp. YIM 121038]|uniref:DUF6197 family protein n=1 Tax=Streptomyces sp. YIM 121038 TaxID=2136401 RepID=UPI0011105F46|nr:hypothetical protein [Streptomyces sp. YIM 121038]QCX81169.1 hypothetical protein C9F11_37930 [Streptomyces sp. YIM 121038]